MKNIVLTYKNISITINEGDRIIYNKPFEYRDEKSSPLWGGAYGKIIGTILPFNDKRCIVKFSGLKQPFFPIRILWDNGEINGFGLPWIPYFTIISRQKQLKLF